jgi:hypothetical protein
MKDDFYILEGLMDHEDEKQELIAWLEEESIDLETLNRAIEKLFKPGFKRETGRT